MVSFCSIGSWLFGIPREQTWNLKMRLSKIGISSCFWGAPIFRCNVLVFLCVSLIEICKSLDFTIKAWKALFEVVFFQLPLVKKPLKREITHEISSTTWTNRTIPTAPGPAALPTKNPLTHPWPWKSKVPVKQILASPPQGFLDHTDGWYPKMDGLLWKTLLKYGWFGGTTISGNTHTDWGTEWRVDANRLPVTRTLKRKTASLPLKISAN